MERISELNSANGSEAHPSSRCLLHYLSYVLFHVPRFSIKSRSLWKRIALDIAIINVSINAQLIGRVIYEVFVIG